MATKRVTELSAGTIANPDHLMFVDADDLTDSPQGTNKRTTFASLAAQLPGSGGGGITGYVDISNPPAGLVALTPNSEAAGAANKTALQAIVNYCITNKTVCWIPVGDWFINWGTGAVNNIGVNVTGDCTFQGASREQSRIRTPIAQPVAPNDNLAVYLSWILFFSDDWPSANITFRDLTVVGPDWPPAAGWWPHGYYATKRITTFHSSHPIDADIRYERVTVTGAFHATLTPHSPDGTARQYILDCDIYGLSGVTGFQSGKGSNQTETHVRNSVFRSNEFHDESQYTFPITGVSIAGTTLTITTATPHNLWGSGAGGNGEYVMFTGMNTNGLSGFVGDDGFTRVQVLTTPSPTTFTISRTGVTGTYDGSGANFIYDWKVHGQGFYGHSNVNCDFTNVRFVGGFRAALRIQGASVTDPVNITAVSMGGPYGRVMTCTTAAPHTYLVGADVLLRGLQANGMTRVDEEPARNRIIAVPSPTTFSVYMYGPLGPATGTYTGSGGSVILAAARYMRANGCTFETYAEAIETSELRGGVMEVNDCTILSYGFSGNNDVRYGQMFLGGCDVTFTNTKFWGSGPICGPQDYGIRGNYRFVACDFRIGWGMQGSQSSLYFGGPVAGERAAVTIIGGYAYLGGNCQFLAGGAGSPTDLIVDGLVIEGGLNRTVTNEVFRVGNGTAKIVRCQFIGKHSTIVASTDSNTEEVIIEECDFRQTQGPILFASTELNNKVFGRGNKFAAGNEPSWSIAAPAAQYFEPRNATNPSALTAAATLTPNMHFTTFHVAAGSPTNVSNIYVGGTVNTDRCRSGMLVVVADDANTTYLVSGNIRTLSGSSLTPTAGQATSFRKDDTAGLWRQV